MKGRIVLEFYNFCLQIWAHVCETLKLQFSLWSNHPAQNQQAPSTYQLPPTFTFHVPKINYLLDHVHVYVSDLAVHSPPVIFISNYQSRVARFHRPLRVKASIRKIPTNSRTTLYQ